MLHVYDLSNKYRLSAYIVASIYMMQTSKKVKLSESEGKTNIDKILKEKNLSKITYFLVKTIELLNFLNCT